MPARAPYVLAIDQGTTGTHVLVFDGRLRLRGKAYQEFRQHFPKPGWVEHRLDEIWSSVETCIGRALRDAGIRGAQVSAIGITNQRETVGLWERSPRARARAPALAPAIVWQDRRTADTCAALKAQGLEPWVREHTGLVLDPYFSGTKLSWLLEHVPGARTRAESGDVCAGTIDTYLVYRLTAGQAHVTDPSNASRTLLFGLKSLRWEPALMEKFGVPPALLPSVRSSAEVYGTTRGLRVLPDGVPVSGMAGDQQAALFGQACFSPGDAKCTYGTGAFLLMNVGDTPVPSTHGLLTTVAWQIGGRTTYALEGSAFIAGAAVQWLRDGLGLISRSSDIETLARKVKSSEGVVFVPALSGLGAPHWKPEARGLLWGMDRGTTKAHVARAVLEGVALTVYELADAMRKESGRDIGTFRVDGGASANALLMQFQADLLDVPVVRPAQLDSTAVGAALLAGLGAGIWAGVDALPVASRRPTVFRPKMAAPERDRHLALWRRAVERA
ncbi:MAG: glycerol kinase GlpK [Myxococcaceae bacterium]